jgi:hypothetical protein
MIWVKVVYHVAFQCGPPPFFERTTAWQRAWLPEGLIIASLPLGVFMASAQAAEHLARGLVPRKPAGGAHDGEQNADKPRWECHPKEKKYELRFGKTRCGVWTRRAKNQHAVLDKFEEKGWPAEITTGLGGKANRDTVDDLNESLSEDSPIEFMAVGSNVVRWFIPEGKA